MLAKADSIADGSQHESDANHMCGITIINVAYSERRFRKINKEWELVKR